MLNDSLVWELLESLSLTPAERAAVIKTVKTQVRTTPPPPPLNPTKMWP